MKFVKSNNVTSQIEFKNIKSILSMYLYTLGTLFLGFSIYLFISLNDENNSFVTWSGEGLFWSLIIFLVSLFVLFLPTEFFNSTFLSNSSFKDLLSNTITVISFSLFFLIINQILINSNNIVVNQLQQIIRSVSFSGFITIPICLFIFQRERVSTSARHIVEFSLDMFKNDPLLQENKQNNPYASSCVKTLAELTACCH